MSRLGRSPFYRTRLGDVGPLDPASLERLPLTRRDDLFRDQLENLPLGTRRLPGSAPVRVGMVGSGESLLVLAWSAAELECERAAGVRVLRRLGVAPGMRVANTLPGALATPGSLLLGDVVEELGGLDVPLGTEATREAWELVDRVRPEVLVVDGPALLSAAPPAARPWWRGIVWLGSATTPLPPAAGFTGWERRWLAVPEATSFVGGSCTASRLHVDEAIFAEIVDERTGKRIPPGGQGTLALTPLRSETPLLRYASGLRASMDSGQCDCGTPGPVVEMA